MARDIRTKAHLRGGEIRTKANFGQTVAITVLPDPYEGATTVTPSDERQTLPTRGKTVPVDILVLPAPVESLATSENGTFTPSSGNVGFSEVVVDVEPSLESLSVTENGLYLPESGTDGFDRVSVDVPPTVPVLQGKAVNPSETAQHVTPDSGYDGLSAVDVGAIPSSYVGSGITRRSSSDLSASDGTVSVPSGYYAESGSKSVQTGTAGIPTASKSAVSNNAVTVTPAVSNSEGYISGGTLTGNAVTVSASELVSGTENITANGTYDVVNKASAVVNVPSQAPVLDSLSVTQNGTYTPASGVDGFDEVAVNVPVSDWSAPVLVYEGDFSAVTSAFAVTELPNGDPFSFDKIVVELSHVQQGQNVNKRTYWRSDMPMTGYNEPLIIDGGSNYRYNVTYHAVTTITIEDDTYISLIAYHYDESNPTSTGIAMQRKDHGGYDKITAYAWWAWNCPAGTHIKITGYNRTS